MISPRLNVFALLAVDMSSFSGSRTEDVVVLTCAPVAPVVGAEAAMRPAPAGEATAKVGGRTGGGKLARTAAWSALRYAEKNARSIFGSSLSLSAVRYLATAACNCGFILPSTGPL